MKECKAKYSKLESFGLVDGPGVRSIIFLSGCPLRCLYCHNPEMQDINCGEDITPEEAFNKLVNYKEYWGKKGGITISGGEPLIHLDFLIELGKLCKKNNVNFCIDTSGYPFRNEENYLKKFDELLENCDLFLLDLKSLKDENHKKITGVSNSSILELYDYLGKKNFPIWVRYVLLPGYTDDEDDLIKISKFLKQYANIRRVEVLPYHVFGAPKYEKLNREYLLKDVVTPTKEEIDKAEKLLDISYFNGYLND